MEVEFQGSDTSRIFDGSHQCFLYRAYSSWIVSRWLRRLVPILILGICFLLWCQLGTESTAIGRHLGGLKPTNLTAFGKIRIQQPKPDQIDNPLRPQIFLYNLPENFSRCMLDTPEQPWNKSIYGSEIIIPPWIRNSKHFTANPEDADFFYVPALFYCISDNQWATFANQTVNWLQQNSEYWKRKAGTDHIFTLTQDHGFCGMARNQGTVPVLKRSILLSHWGLKNNEIACDWTERLDNFGHCHLRKEPEKFLAQGTFDQCYLPAKDIVIPPVIQDDVGQVRPIDVVKGAPRLVECGSKRFVFTYSRALNEEFLLNPAAQEGLEIDAFNATLPKKYTLYFIGGIRPKDLTYSHGTRQTLHQMFKNHPSLKVLDSEVDPFHPTAPPVIFPLVEMAQSIFCLALTGAGWGVQLKMSLMAGCIPVVIADEVEMEFEEVLPYQDFAFRIPQHRVYRLPEFLEEILQMPGRVAAMQQRLNCAWQWMSYNAEFGRAGQTLLCSLRRRLFGAKSVWPAMDWRTCTLICGSRTAFEDARTTSVQGQISLADYDQRLVLEFADQ